MLTNKSSLIDGCMIEECVSTSTTGTATFFMDLLGGKVSDPVLRNNLKAGSSGGGVTAYPNADMIPFKVLADFGFTSPISFQVYPLMNNN